MCNLNEQTSTHHMNTHDGGLDEEGRFLPALWGRSLQQSVGARRHGGAGMWIKQHGGKILGLLASACFLLISHLVVQHVGLTTTLRSAPSAEWLCAGKSERWQRKSFFICWSGARYSEKNPPAEFTDLKSLNLQMFSFNSLPYRLIYPIYKSHLTLAII